MNLRRAIVAGLAASIVMGMIEMVYEGLAGAGFWSPLVFIGATVLRGLQSVQVPVSFHPAGVVLGLMGHMMNSALFGILFGWIVSRAAMSRGRLLQAGALYGLVIFLVMWYAVVPALDPVMLNLNGVVFAIAHVVWGAVLGLAVPQALRTGEGLQAA